MNVWNLKTNRAVFKLLANLMTHEELGTLMKLTIKKYAHEIIDLLIHYYVENQLTPEQKRKLNY
ncbi:hypothetical protein COM96_22490 [Bacillus cereus]|uniref:Uncharacterized protein n=1 Tax=Bacillus cereus TaxID=1396 RepID=A0A2A7HSZ1_BACCE|nr:hypothetical protein COM96_22490 [Bacillus cereus]